MAGGWIGGVPVNDYACWASLYRKGSVPEEVKGHWHETPDLGPAQDDRKYVHKELAEGIHVAALFEGYKGSVMAARVCRDKLVDYLRRYAARNVPPEEAVERIFSDLSVEIRAQYLRDLGGDFTDQEVEAPLCPAAAGVVVLIINSHIFTGSMGNCRAVLWRTYLKPGALNLTKKAVDLTRRDHTTAEAAERERFEEDGGTLVPGTALLTRVIGGDPDARGLSWEPEIKDLDLLDGDKLIVLGSGQAFGHHDDMVVLDKAMRTAHKTNLSPVQKLYDYAQEIRGGNLTVGIINLTQLYKPENQAARKRRRLAEGNLAEGAQAGNGYLAV